MKKIALTGILLATSCIYGANADEPPVLSQPAPADDMLFEKLHPELKAVVKAYPKLELLIDGIEDGKPIPHKFTYCKPDDKGQTQTSENLSPAIHWINGPDEAKSYALLVVNPDVPANFDKANKPGEEIPVKAPRQNFFHWVLADIPANLAGLLEGADSKGVKTGGKMLGRKSYGINGRNDYSKFAAGDHGGYDGPCPPWNDLRLHHYHFVVYALDVPSLGLRNPITGPQVLMAIEGHILAKGEITGIYSTNTRWQEQLKNDMAGAVKLIPGEKFEPSAN